MPATKQATRLELHHQLLAAILFGSKQGHSQACALEGESIHRAEPLRSADVDTAPSTFSYSTVRSTVSKWPSGCLLRRLAGKKKLKVSWSEVALYKLIQNNDKHFFVKVQYNKLSSSRTESTQMSADGWRPVEMDDPEDISDSADFT